ncbi:MAG: M23 family metallopeptidase [Candidatus Gracilibacteria bacterium]|nr:M23 family metallopeptidase [Candidatus Gracilibacteria bacterium]
MRERRSSRQEGGMNLRTAKPKYNWRLPVRVVLATLGLMHKPLDFAYAHAGINRLSRSKRALISLLVLGLSIFPIFGSVTPTVQAEDAIDMPTFDGNFQTDDQGYMDKMVSSEDTFSEWTEYYVAEGDTLESIAEEFGVKKATLEAVNRSKVRNFKVGLKLFIPPYSDGIMHLASSGESLNGIAALYDVDVAAIKLANDDLDRVIAGHYYFIPGDNVKAVRRDTYTYVDRGSGYTSSNLPAKSGMGAGWTLPLDAYTYIRGFYYGHYGVDLANKTGTPIYAVESGTVLRAEPSGWNGGYGLMVQVDHGGNVSTLYAHMSQVNVQAGDAVSKGQVLGLMGSTGRSTGPHLHFEVHEKTSKFNPADYLDFI